MAQLPLVIKRDVRDKFDATDSSIQQQLFALKDTIGLPVHLDVTWSLLWAEYEQKAVEKATFVPYIIRYVDTLLSALSGKLEEDDSPWTEMFLEYLAQFHGLRLDLRTCKEKNAILRCSDEKTLVLHIPIDPVTAPIPSSQFMLGQLEDLFTNPKGSSSSTTMEGPSRPSTSSSTDPIHTPLSSSTFTSDFPFSNSTKQPSPLPTLDSLPRPDTLLTNSTSHIIHMHIEHNRDLNRSTQISSRLTIQSSHEPSLRLIHDYFAKWTRPDPQTREKIPLMRHTLCPSAIGHHHDTLVIEPFSQMSARSGSLMNPALYQCFIESVLGYEVVCRGSCASEGVNGGTWEFRRSRPFM